MLTQPLQKVIDFIDAHPDGIYVWVTYPTPTGPVNRSIVVKGSDAYRWARETAKDLNGVVPCFMGGSEMFLGVCPVV